MMSLMIGICRVPESTCRDGIQYRSSCSPYSRSESTVKILLMKEFAFLAPPILPMSGSSSSRSTQSSLPTYRKVKRATWAVAESIQMVPATSDGPGRDGTTSTAYSRTEVPLAVASAMLSVSS